jgi:hypothetical protein
MIPNRFDSLPEVQRRVVPLLGPIARECGYYLAGGTAVALYFGHRESVDFDFFAADPTLCGQPLLDRLLTLGVKFQTTSLDPGTLLGSVDGVKISFIRYRYPLVAPVHALADPVLDVAAIPDLCAMKLSAADQRGTRKDFIDIHRLMIAGTALPAMLDYYRQKFATPNIQRALMGLTYFDDAETQPMPRTLIPMDWGKIKTDIAAAVRDASRRRGG